MINMDIDNSEERVNESEINENKKTNHFSRWMEKFRVFKGSLNKNVFTELMKFWLFHLFNGSLNEIIQKHKWNRAHVR